MRPPWACRPFSLGNLSSGLCALHETVCRATRSMEAGRSRVSPTACAPVAAQWCTKDGIAGAQGSAGSQRCTIVHKWRAMRNPWQRRVPRALVHRGRPRGWAHVACGGKRKRSHTPSRLGSAAGGWRLAAGGWRLAAGGCGATWWHQEAAGAAHSLAVVVLGGCVSGWQRGTTDDRFLSPAQATSAQPSGLTRCTSARGTRRCQGARVVVIGAQVCSAGTRRCLVFLVAILCARLCSDGRARSQMHT
jgi:hypothetical protein